MITTNTGAKKLESSDNWREIFPDNQGAQGAHNASVGAHDAAICQTCQTINGTTNNSGHTINSGEFFIANGGKYKATASIPNGEPWASSAEPVTDNDLIGALNSNLTNITTPEVVTFTPVTNVSIGLGGVFKVGKVVYFNFRLDLSAAISNGKVGTFSILPKRATGLTANNLIGVAVTRRDSSNNNFPMYGILNAVNGDLSIHPSDSLTPLAGFYTVMGFYVID